eukprot:11180094-Lingulodinium_polyedra.AAC.1
MSCSGPGLTARQSGASSSSPLSPWRAWAPPRPTSGPTRLPWTSSSSSARGSLASPPKASSQTTAQGTRG